MSTLTTLISINIETDLNMFQSFQIPIEYKRERVVDYLTIQAVIEGKHEKVTSQDGDVIPHQMLLKGCRG